MNTRLTFAAAMLTGALAASAQTLQEPNAVFQYFSTEAAPAMPLMAQAKPVTGRPLAAVESRHTLQVLADGTRIERRDNNKYYRDSEGRTRTESSDGNRVTIADSANGSTVEMNTADHSARRAGFVRAFEFKSASGDKGPLPPLPSQEKLEITTGGFSGGIRTAIADHIEGITGSPGIAASSLAVPAGAITIIRHADSAAAAKDAKVENLGIQNINGVLAEGTRTTIRIPTGEIGNDRPISIVNEKWFSTAIGLLVKSVNSDPRFGETTYELTEIREGVQDPSLFQVPADYNANGRR